MKDVTKIYCDGGVIGQNPSDVGGTWAYILLNKDEWPVLKGSGVVTPGNMNPYVITNNYTELIAAVLALELMEDGWDGVLHTDSNVTRCRLVNKNAAMNGIPESLQLRVQDVLARLGRFSVVLLSGHPTEAQLRAGKGKGGRPVSKWNVLCDEACTAAAVKHRRTI